MIIFFSVDIVRPAYRRPCVARKASLNIRVAGPGGPALWRQAMVRA
jgi:hypothetical protein